MRMRALGCLALVIRTAPERVLHVDLFDDQDPVLDVDLAFRL